MPRPRRLLLILGGIATASGCSLLTSLDDLRTASDAASDAAGDGGSDAAGDSSSPCPSSHGPKMVVVPTINPAGSYCIDSTEVTEAQYSEFLAAKVDAGSQPPACAANTSFAPSAANECATHLYDPTNHPTFPVTCIDWCDAYAYCAWAGKRLCGEIGAGGGSVAVASASDPVHDQWFSACSAEGARAYPYGQTYDASVCNGVDRSGNMVVPVGSLPGCAGGYPGLFDLSGNASEWENSCEDASPDGDVHCALRGGSIFELSGQLTCTQSDLQSRSATNYNQGFRCCADL